MNTPLKDRDSSFILKDVMYQSPQSLDDGTV